MRFTDALITPSVDSSAFSTRLTQEAQVIPVTETVRCSDEGTVFVIYLSGFVRKISCNQLQIPSFVPMEEQDQRNQFEMPALTHQAVSS